MWIVYGSHGRCQEVLWVRLWRAGDIYLHDSVVKDLKGVSDIDSGNLRARVLGKGGRCQSRPPSAGAGEVPAAARRAAARSATLSSGFANI